MSTTIPLITGSYVTADPRASSKRLVGAFSEQTAQTSSADTKNETPPIYMRRWPGTVPLASDGTSNPVRGFRKMGTVTYVVIGPILYSISAAGVLTQIGTGIQGNGFVRMADNKACLFILVPNSYTAYTYCPSGGGFSQFTNATFLSYGARDVWFVDSYFVFLMVSGLGFYNDDGQVISGNGPPTFTSAAVFGRQFGTDLLYGMVVDHREVVVLGELTTECYVNVGIPTGSPFSNAPDGFMQIGVHPLAGYTAALQDQSVFWVANDKTVRRRNGQTPVRVSNSGIEEILQSADLTGSYAITPTIAGHPFWICTIPAISRSIAYDCLTSEWCEAQSLINNLGYWRPLCWYNSFGLQLVGDSQSGSVASLSTNSFTEFGSPLETIITTQPIYDRNFRITHRRLELVITAGASTSLLVGALVTLFVSNDSGQTWYARETKSLGALGQRGVTTHWENLGQARNRVYRFQISDPSPLFTVDIQATLDGGKW